MIDWSTIQIAVALGGAFLAGIINTFAGNGSMITLTIMMEILGLPADIANASNRVGILSQTAPSSWMLYRDHRLTPKKDRAIILFTVIGAIVGVWLALITSNAFFRQVFRVLLVFLFVLILLRPSRWLSPKRITDSWPPIWRYVIFFCLGIYGGFIQMGMGLFCLAVLVLLEGRNLIHANAFKLFVVGIYTAIVLLIFGVNGLIYWPVALLFAFGQTIGGLLATRWMTRIKGIEKAIYALLVLIIIASILKVFNIFPFF